MPLRMAENLPPLWGARRLSEAVWLGVLNLVRLCPLLLFIGRKLVVGAALARCSKFFLQAAIRSS